MAAPALTHTGQRLYDSLAQLATDDESYDFALAHFCHAIASTIDEVADLTRDADDGTVGYAAFFDLDTIAEKYLPWVAQFIGVRIPAGLTDAGKRLRIRETDGFKRGTPDAIRGAARQYLTGDKEVFLVERYGSAYRLIVATYDDETSQANYDDFVTDYATYDLLEADFATYTALISFATRFAALIREQIPAGIMFEHRVITRGTYDEVRDTHSDYDDIEATYLTYAEIYVDPSKQ